MNPDILFRSEISLVIIAAGVMLYWLSNRWMLGRAASQFDGLITVPVNKPVLVYFTTPTCAPCKTIQKPAIERVQDILGEHFQVIEINAAEQPEMARRWGVVSVPTTFVLDAHGKARHVNNGVVRAEKLLKQLHGL